MTGINTGATGLKTFTELYGTGYQPTGGPISTPALQNNPQAPVPNVVQDGTNSFEKSPKSDTITIAGKTINKKTAIKAGLGAVAAAAVIGIGFFAFRGRGKTPPIPVEPPVQPPVPAPVPEGAPLDPAKLADELQASANEMLQRANEVIEAAQKKIEAVTELFKNGGKDASGKVVAQIEDSANPKIGEKIMREYSKDGSTIVRESRFNANKICVIADFSEDGPTSFTSSFPNGGITFQDKTRELKYYPNVRKGAINYTEDAGAKKLEVINGQLATYQEDTVTNESGSFIGKFIHFLKEGPGYISVKETKVSDGTSTETFQYFEKLEDGTWELQP